MPKNKNYFGKQEEEAIRKYIKKETTDKEKEKLHKEIILPAFKKLSENIINTYGTKHRFFELGYSFEELMKLSLSILHSKIYLFDSDRIGKSGQRAKAYSFFGTVLKRDLIILSMKKQKNDHRHLSIDDEDNYMNRDLNYTDINDIDEKFFIKEIAVWYEKYAGVIKINTDTEKDILNALLYHFKNIDNLEMFNKKAIYIAIREMTGVDSSKITPVLNKMKSVYPTIRDKYLEYGIIGSGSFYV